MKHPHQPSGEAEWWLCSHLVSVAVAGSDSGAGVALLEEISATGVRLVVDEPIAEGSRARLTSRGFEAGLVVTACRVRSDDFLIEARFDEGRHWTPDIWSPDHLYRPARARRRAKSAGQS